jgi:hypothetical protein
MSEIKSGLAIHCHHDILFEFCFGYDNRVRVIKNSKPKNEQEIRLRLFRLLPKEAIAELPVRFVKAYADRDKADREIWHKKWCGCREWDGNEINFSSKGGER